jgi:hypothetical protein
MSALSDEQGVSRSATPLLGALLVERGLLSEEQLASGLAEQGRTGEPLGKVFVQLGFVDAVTVAQALATQHGGVLKTEYGFATGFGNGRPRAPAPEPPVSAASSDAAPVSPWPGLAPARAVAAGEPPGSAEASVSPGRAGLPGSHPAVVAAVLPKDEEVESALADQDPARVEFESAARITDLEADLASAVERSDGLQSRLAEMEAEAAAAHHAAHLRERLVRERLADVERRLDIVLAEVAALQGKRSQPTENL